ncbi:MAG: hypothetical protein ACOY90_00020 [Candidatus Zhuqueibacterota bacterium]
MTTFFRNKNLILAVVSIFLISISGCDKNPAEPEKKTPPTLPPVESMQLELSFFDNTPGNSLAKSAMSKNNFTAAAFRVWFINAGIVLASIVPTAIFISAVGLDKEPELERDGKFHWTYSVQHGLNTFGVDLAGWVDIPNSEVVWEVYVTSNTHVPQLDHFLWYTGRATIGNEEGWWLFYDDLNPTSNLEVLKIEWAIQDSVHKHLIFSNIKQASPDYGDTLKYEENGVDNSLTFFDASANKTNTIYWNSSDFSGYIEWFDYNNGVKSYWDEDQNDSSGPSA